MSGGRTSLKGSARQRSVIGLGIISATHLGKRPVSLSITHKLLCSAEGRAQSDVGEPGKPAPRDCIAWWWITGACEVAAEPCDFDQIIGERVFPP